MKTSEIHLKMKLVYCNFSNFFFYHRVIQLDMKYVVIGMMYAASITSINVHDYVTLTFN